MDVTGTVMNTHGSRDWEVEMCKVRGEGKIKEEKEGGRKGEREERGRKD